jgi:type IV pilus assembly protein PilF
MNPKPTRLLALLMAAALLAGCASSAERKEARAKKENMVATQLQLAATYLQRGQIEVAKENINRALAVDPDHSQANNMMALLQWRQKDYDAAERHFRQALRADDNNAEAQNNFGAFLCERGRVEEAEDWFKLALTNPLYSTPAAANENAGLCLMKKQAYAKAEPYFREALKIDPKRSASLYQMALISYQSGRTLAARGFMQRFFQQGSEDTPEVLLLAVKIERALKNKNEEASYALRLRARFPTSPEAQQLQQLQKPRTATKG